MPHSRSSAPRSRRARRVPHDVGSDAKGAHMSQTIAQQHIEIPQPDVAEPTLLLQLGPCRVRFSVSDGPAWVMGTYTDPSGVLPIDVKPGPTTTISQRFDPAAFANVTLPMLELAFSRERPFSLQLNAGASESAFDLGGVPLVKLVVNAGAGKFDLDFAQPNPTTMRALEISAGAGAMTAKRLANAGFTFMKCGGGVSATTLDFSGALVRDASVRIDAGLGSVDVFAPALTPVRVKTKTFAAGVRASGGFSKQQDGYATTPAIQGARPMLEIEASISFGALNLATT